MVRFFGPPCTISLTRQIQTKFNFKLLHALGPRSAGQERKKRNEMKNSRNEGCSKSSAAEKSGQISHFLIPCRIRGGVGTNSEREDNDRTCAPSRKTRQISISHRISRLDKTEKKLNMFSFEIFCRRQSWLVSSFHTADADKTRHSHLVRVCGVKA